MKCKFFQTPSPAKVQMCRALYGVLGWFISLSWSQHKDTLKAKHRWLRGRGWVQRLRVLCLGASRLLPLVVLHNLLPLVKILHFGDATSLVCPLRGAVPFSPLLVTQPIQSTVPSLIVLFARWPFFTLQNAKLYFPYSWLMYLGHLFFQCCIIVFPWGHISSLRDLSSWRMGTLISSLDSPEHPLHLLACSFFFDKSQLCWSRHLHV